MTEEVKAHEISTSMVKVVPAEVDGGADITLKVKVSCSSACDLRGKMVKIIAQDTVVKEIELVSFDATANETDEFAVKAPIALGVYTWTAVFPAQEKEGVPHEEGAVPFSFIVKPHTTSIETCSVPSRIVFGDEFRLKVRVSCSSACDLRGIKVRIMAQDAVVKEVELVSFDGTVNETGEFVVRAPIEPGIYTWTAVLSAKQSAIHEENSVPFSFVVKGHATSIGVWEVPSPIAFGDKFRLKVGVGCPAACMLTDSQIEVYDHEGALVATGTLGDFSWSGASALSCAEVELTAPSIEGRYRWTVKFPKQELALPHEEASCTFAFAAARQAEHVVTVVVIDKDTKTPVNKADVVFVPQEYRGFRYESRTDEGGVARVGVPQNTYRANVRGADGKEAFLGVVEVAGDMTLEAELSVPEEDNWVNF